MMWACLCLLTACLFIQRKTKNKGVYEVILKGLHKSGAIFPPAEQCSPKVSLPHYGEGDGGGNRRNTKRPHFSLPVTSEVGVESVWDHRQNHQQVNPDFNKNWDHMLQKLEKCPLEHQFLFVLPLIYISKETLLLLLLVSHLKRV